MEFFQSIFVIASIFLIMTGFFNKAYRFKMYALAVILLASAYAIHYHRIANEPGYAERLKSQRATIEKRN